MYIGIYQILRMYYLMADATNIIPATPFSLLAAIYLDYECSIIRN